MDPHPVPGPAMTCFALSRSSCPAALVLAGAALLTGAVFPSAATPADEEASFDHEHAMLTELLAQVASEEGVHYALLKEKGDALDDYLEQLTDVEPDAYATWSADERYAFWINAYNAYTLRLVVDHLPLESIRDIHFEGEDGEEVGPWQHDFIPLGGLRPEVGGARLSLDEIEHEILRPTFEDARVHVAINCASKGCPPLRTSAFTGASLQEELDAASLAWLADEESARFEQEARRAHVSQLFQWFEEDFVRDASSLAGWLARFAPAEHREWLEEGPVEVKFLEYDWGLNRAPESEEGTTKGERRE